MILIHYPANRSWEYSTLSRSNFFLNLSPNSRNLFARKYVAAGGKISNHILGVKRPIFSLDATHAATQSPLTPKFPDYWKPSKIVFLGSHPGHIVVCFTVNTFAIRHFTVSLEYLKFCPVESVEKYFLGSVPTLCTAGSAKRTTFEFFHFLEALEDSK